MFFSPNLVSRVDSSRISIETMASDYHDSLGVFKLNLGAIGCLYLDFDSAEVLLKKISTSVEEYLSSDVATVQTDTLDSKEVD